MQALSLCLRPNPTSGASASLTPPSGTTPAPGTADAGAGPSQVAALEIESAPAHGPGHGPAHGPAEDPSDHPATSARPPQPQAAGLARRLQTAAAQTLVDLRAAPFNQGLGVTQTIQSVHPGRVTTRSAEPKLASNVRQQGQARPASRPQGGGQRAAQGKRSPPPWASRGGRSH